MLRHPGVCCLTSAVLLLVAGGIVSGQEPGERGTEIKTRLTALQEAIDKLRTEQPPAVPIARPQREDHLADVEVFAKAAEWILRHNEFYKPEYVDQTLTVLKLGQERAKSLGTKQTPWTAPPGKRTVLGYRSRVDGSVQPYVVSFPADYGKEPNKKWPLYVVLHGRADTMNEVNFIARNEGKNCEPGQTWIQLEVFGRTNNAYRWAGETDVFEAIDDVKRRVRIDEQRIALWGFSMGGAGAWHLGMHYPSTWCAVGAGAGFVDYYGYQKKTDKLPEWQDATLKIYDAVPYAGNAAMVPTITYGGEKDPQLLASTTMVEAAKKENVTISSIVGPNMGHAFDPASKQEFMVFLAKHVEQGRPSYPGRREFRFVTYSLKYSKAEWVQIEEMRLPYTRTTVEVSVKPSGDFQIKTDNVAVLSLDRNVASFVEIDGSFLPLANAAEGLLPVVYYEKVTNGWRVISYEASKEYYSNLDLMKRPGVQGPIDDAFMEPFVCVTGTGKPWNQEHQQWADWTLQRFEGEFDKWMRAKVPVIKDGEISEDVYNSHHLILFGDPGSNKFISRILEKLPMKWSGTELTVNGQTYDPKTHGVALVYPNPLNPRKYVVINSGHTIHEKDFKSTNAALFPRLGDIAVLKFTKQGEGYQEEIQAAHILNSGWRFPPPTEGNVSR